MFLCAGMVLLLLTSCARIYHSPDADIIADSHQKIAIIPPRVTIEAPRRVSREDLKKQTRTTGYAIQGEMYSWLLKRKRQGKILIDVQDLETTNALLGKADFFKGKAMTPQEISEILGVDAVVTSNYLLTRPISEAGSIALTVLTGGAWLNDKEANVTLDIYDSNSQKTIWNYRNTHSGELWESHADLVNDVLRHASRKMPYVR